MRKPKDYETVEASEETVVGLQSKKTRRKRPVEKFHKTMLMPIMMNLKKKWFTGNFLKKFTSLIALNYRKDYAFLEEWEESEPSRHPERHPSDFHLFLNETEVRYSVLQSVQLFLSCMCLWYASLRDLLVIEDLWVFFAVALLCLPIGNMVVELMTVHLVDNMQEGSWAETVRGYAKRELCWDLCCLFAGIVYLVAGPATELSAAASILACTGLLFKVAKQSKFFNELLEETYMSRYFKVANVLLIMLFAAHVFSIILNALADNLHDNWLVKIQKDTQPWAIRYLYAMYWSITTMVTVGYGDIVPANQYEVVVIMIIEILGTTLSAYLINTIGSTLSNLRKDAEKMEYNLNVLKKTSKYFSLSKELSYRIRNCLENNHKVESAFSVEDEKNLMDSLNQQLRRDVIYETNMKVIKKNVFFMTHFTKNFRSQIALRLIKKIYQPGQTLEIDPECPSLFIVDKGTVDIFVKLDYRNKSFEKLIRKIDDNEDSLVRRNMYGLGSLFQRSVPLRTLARAQSFAFAYELQKNTFMELLLNNPQDFQSFYELRDKMSSLRLPEAVEGESLVDEKKHFCPRRILILRKYCYSKSQQRTSQSDFLSMLRNQRRISTRYPSRTQIAEEVNQDGLSIVACILDQLQPAPEDKFTRRQNNIDVHRNYDSYFVIANPKTVFEKYSLFNVKKCVDDGV